MSMHEKSIWIINHYASHLETRHLELAKAFARSGYRVAVITSSFHHGKREYLYDEPVRFVERADNVFFVYLHSEPAYYGNSGKRVLNMLDFCRRFSRSEKEIERKLGAPRFVIGSSAHPFVWESAYACARRYGAKFIAEFRDIWPLSLVEVQGVSPRHPFVLLLSVIEKRAYRRADAIVSTMEFAYRHVCEAAGVPREKVHWIPNGINTEEIDQKLRSGIELPDELRDYLRRHWCCVYTGSIAKCEHVDYLVEAFRYVRDPDIRLTIIGAGGEKDAIAALAEKNGLKNVRIFPPVSKDQVHSVLQEAGCCAAAIPDYPLLCYGLSKYKLSDYIYAGKPVVFACNADNVVKTAGQFAVPYGDPQKMAETIEAVKRMPPEKLREMGTQGKRLIREQYDLNQLGLKYLSIMEGL